MKSKSLLCMILVAACLVMGTIPLYAAEVNEISVYRWSYIRSVSCDIYFNGTQGSVLASVYGNSSVTRIVAKIDFYYKNIFNIWVKVNQGWSYDVNSDELDIYETFNAVSGREYKTLLSATVYAGTNSESISLTATGTCP